MVLVLVVQMLIDLVVIGGGGGKGENCGAGGGSGGGGAGGHLNYFAPGCNAGVNQFQHKLAPITVGGGGAGKGACGNYGARGSNSVFNNHINWWRRRWIRRKRFIWCKWFRWFRWRRCKGRWHKVVVIKVIRPPMDHLHKVTSGA